MAALTTAALAASAITAGTAIVGGISDRNAANSAQRHQDAATDQQLQLYRDMYNQSRSDNEPFRQFGIQQANAMGELLQYDPVGGANMAGGGGGNAMTLPSQGQAPAYYHNAFGGINRGEWAGGSGAGGNFQMQRLAAPLPGMNAPQGGQPGGNAFLQGGQNQPQSGNFTLPNAPYANQPQNAPAGAQPQQAGGLAPTLGSGVAGADRFNNSAWNAVFTNDFNRDRTAIDNNLAGSGLAYSGARMNAVENSRANNFSNAFGQYTNFLMGAPNMNAANANSQAGNVFANQAGNAFGQQGANRAQSAYNKGDAFSSAFGGFMGSMPWGKF